MNLDFGLSFLQGLDLEDPIEDEFAGRVELDLEMADVKAIDEGATIAGILNEARRLQEAQQELKEAYSTIASEREKAAASERQALAQAEENAILREKLAEAQKASAATTEEQPSQSDEFQEPKRHKKKRRAKKNKGVAGGGHGSSAPRP